MCYLSYFINKIAGLIYTNLAFFPGPLKNGTNFSKQLLKLPTQRPSSLPWWPRPDPIEQLNICYFYITSTNSLHCVLAHTAHICWRWVALPFADQTFRFRTLFFSSVCSFFYPSLLGMHCGGICHFNLVSTHLHTPNWHFRLSGSHKTFPFSYMKCLCLLKFLLDKMFMKV